MMAECRLTISSKGSMLLRKRSMPTFVNCVPM